MRFDGHGWTAEIILGNELHKGVEKYTNERRISIQDALAELIENGLQDWIARKLVEDIVSKAIQEEIDEVEAL